jgi:hypothetical protein
MYASGGIGQLTDIQQQLSDSAKGVDRWCNPSLPMTSANLGQQVRSHMICKQVYLCQAVWWATDSFNWSERRWAATRCTLPRYTAWSWTQLAWNKMSIWYPGPGFICFVGFARFAVNLVRISLCAWWSRLSCHGLAIVILCSPAYQRLQVLRYKESRK